MAVRNRLLRDHSPIVVENFNGLWSRGGDEAVPLDHFAEAINVQYIESGFKTRGGLDTFVPGVFNIVRMYNYKMQDAESLLILNSAGELYHALLDGTETVHGPILTIAAMDDFSMQAVAGRAYINPFENFLDTDGDTRQRGISGEFLYVYLGAGAAARKAAGAPPTGSAMGVAISAGAGFSDLGFHIFAVVYETDTGYLTALGPTTFTTITQNDTAKGYDITSVPVSPDSFVTKRHIVATKKILDYNGDQDGFQFFFVPEGNIDDNTTTTISVDFFDLDLLDDASHLIDNFTEIAAGVGLTTYNSRLVTATFPDPDESLVRFSHPGEPEAINQVDGFVIVPLDGLPVTELQEYRDVFYMFKQTRTWATVDNGNAPATWEGPHVVDQGVGAPVHGIGQVLDTGGVNIEMLLIADLSGLMVFNGAYARPELSWKIQDFWLALTRDEFNKIQIMSDTILQVFYITLPDRTMLIADYANGLNAKDIRFGKWTFDIEANTIALVETNKLIIGALQAI